MKMTDRFDPDDIKPEITNCVSEESDRFKTGTNENKAEAFTHVPLLLLETVLEKRSFSSVSPPGGAESSRSRLSNSKPVCTENPR